jgi:hypothetical protein
MLWALLCSLPTAGIHGCVAVAEPGKEGGESLLKFAARVPLEQIAGWPIRWVEIRMRSAGKQRISDSKHGSS